MPSIRRCMWVWKALYLAHHRLIIDCVALAKQEDNAFGSVRPSVRLCVLSCFTSPRCSSVCHWHFVINGRMRIITWMWLISFYLSNNLVLWTINTEQLDASLPNLPKDSRHNYSVENRGQDQRSKVKISRSEEMDHRHQHFDLAFMSSCKDTGMHMWYNDRLPDL